MTYRTTHILKHTSYVCLLLLTYVLQSTPKLFEIGETKPTLLVAIAIGIAMFEGEFLGGIYGAFAGLLCDTVGYALFGYTGFMLCFLCICVGLLVNNLMQPTLLTYLVLVLVAMFLIYSVSFIFTFAIWRIPALAPLYFKTVALRAVFTTGVSPLFYYLTKGMQGLFDKLLNRYIRTNI